LDFAAASTHDGCSIDDAFSVNAYFRSTRVPIANQGWELHIIREAEQRRASDGKCRTVGRYQVYHDGVRQTAPDLKGTTAESKGPGANEPADNGKRIGPGRYPLWTQEPGRYATWGYKDSESTGVSPKPGFELKDTGDRYEILLHPGHRYLSSIGCINPCTSLPDASEEISYAGSRRRVISLIEDMKAYVGSSFPNKNGKKIPKAFIVSEGEP
jgi:hypothetical protein